MSVHLVVMSLNGCHFSVMLRTIQCRWRLKELPTYTTTLNHHDYFYAFLQQLVNKMQFTGALAKTSNIALHLTNTYHLKGNTIDVITVNFGEDWLRVCY